MKFYKLNSNKQVNINISDYLIDWNRKVSKPQKRVKDFLYPFWKTQVCLEEFVIPGSRLRCDIVNLTKKIVVEVSPSSTHSFNKFFHKNKFTFKASINREFDKEDWCKQSEFKLVEIFDEDMNILSPKWFVDNYEIVL